MAKPGAAISMRTGLYNTYEPMIIDKAVGIGAASGPVTIYARRMDDILTSGDLPGNQPPAGAQTCQGGTYLPT